MNALQPHPRLLASREHLDRARRPSEHPLLRSAEREVEAVAEAGLESTDVPYEKTKHNALLERARAMQYRVLSLAVWWWRTGDERFRAAVVEHVRAMGEWTHWSWLAWRSDEEGPMAQFDLSYGENCATLALAFDWLADTLREEERSVFVEVAQRWGVDPFLHHTGKENPPFWFRRPANNWNTVCTGGAGMLALAMHEHLDRADEVLQRTEESFEPYFRELDETGGGWEEGVGYWNYGMRYAFFYLLSWSWAHGKRHPLLELEGSRRTLEFPLDFTPNAVAAGFGDVNRFRARAFHYALAEAMGREDLYPLLDARVGEDPATAWANPPGLLVFHPRTFARPRENTGPVAKRYPKMDWALLADGHPQPGLCLTLRGGSTDVGHSHLDLMSFHCVVGDEPLLANVPVREYLDTTFSARRNDLWEIRPDAKNTLLVNGVGVRPGSAVAMHDVELDDVPGFVLEGAEAFGEMRDGPVAEVCNRALLLLDGEHALIVDRVRVPHYARMEARFHTAFACETTHAAARITGERNALYLRFASSTAARLHRAINPVTAPALAEAEHMLRWCNDERCHDTWFATLLSRVETSEPVFTDVSQEAATLKMETRARAWTLRFDEAMREIAAEPV